MSARLDVERLTWGPMGRCVACRKHPAIGPMGYCGTCHWELVIEVAEGWAEFDNLLAGGTLDGSADPKEDKP